MKISVRKYPLLILVLILFIISNGKTAGQQNKLNSFQVLWDNDFLNIRGDGTDRYYTNGIRLDLFYLKKQKTKFPSSLLLNISNDNNNIFSWGLAQSMFTPRNISYPDIQYNDRSYSGALFGIHSLQSTHSGKRTRVNTEIRFGVIGPLSFAKETQTWVHNAFNYTKPLGWHNQVPTDIILNYNINIEKQLLYPSRNLLVTGIIETYNGTVYNAAGAGFMLKLGKFQNYLEEYFIPIKKRDIPFQLYLFMKPAIRVVLSNALLQGGLLNQIWAQNTGYTLNKDIIERLLPLYDAGATLVLPAFSLTISQKFIGPEFKGQYTQEFGNLTMKFKL